MEDDVDAETVDKLVLKSQKSLLEAIFAVYAEELKVYHDEQVSVH